MLIDVAITSPILMYEFDRPNERTSTIRDEIYPCADVIFAELIDDVKNA